MPPSKPDTRHHNGHLFQLLRKEFVQSYPKSLCSDSFSGFTMTDPLIQEYNEDVMEATDVLLNQTVPSTTKRLLLLAQEAQNHGTLIDFAVHLPQELHRDGINLRYIGLCYRQLQRMQRGKEILSRLLLVEACARVLKNVLAVRLREKMRQLRVPSEVPYARLTVEFVNTVFGSGDESQLFWNDCVRPKLNLYFNFDFDESDDEPGVLERDVFFSPPATLAAGSGISFAGIGGTGTSSANLLAPPSSPSSSSGGGGGGGSMGSSSMSLVGGGSGSLSSPSPKCNGRWILFKRFCKMAGLQWSDPVKNRFKGVGQWNHREPVGFLDLRQMEERVKHMNIIADAEAKFFHCRGMQEDNPVLSIDLYNQAILKYQTSLAWTPRSKEVLLSSAIAMHNYLDAKASAGISGRTRALAATGGLGGAAAGSANLKPPFPMKDPTVVQADHLFLRANDAAGGRDPVVLCCYAEFLERCQRGERAEDYYLRALEVDPAFLYGNLAYGMYLSRRGLPDADMFLNRGAQRTKHGNMAVSPFAGTVPGSRIRIYLADGTFKTVAVTVGMTTNEIEDRLTAVLIGRLGSKKQFTPDQLFELRRKYTTYALFEKNIDDNVSSFGGDDASDSHHHHGHDDSPSSTTAGGASGGGTGSYDNSSLDGSSSVTTSIGDDGATMSVAAAAADEAATRGLRRLGQDEKPWLVVERPGSRSRLVFAKDASAADLLGGVVVGGRPDSARQLLEALSKLQGKQRFGNNLRERVLILLFDERNEALQIIDEALAGSGTFRHHFKQAAVSRRADPRWVFANVTLVYELVSSLYGIMCSYCDCATMSASDSIEYRIAADHDPGAAATQVAASSYITHVLRDTEQALNFAYSSSQNKLPALSSAKPIAKRLIRIFSHIRFQHWPRITTFGLEYYFYLAFAYAYHFVMQTRLVDKKIDATTLEPLQLLIDDVDKFCNY
jgi:tetratricopeptide (TPR) repeat protein